MHLGNAWDRNSGRLTMLPLQFGRRVAPNIRHRETGEYPTLPLHAADSTKAESSRSVRAFEENLFLRGQIRSAIREWILPRRSDTLPDPKANRFVIHEAASFRAVV